MKTKTEQGRTIRSAREELELGAGNVKALVSGWRQRLHDDPGSFPDYDVFGVINGWQPAEEEATLKFSSQLSR